MARRRLIWTIPALDDLDEIAAFIALDNPGAAAVLARRCIDAVDRLLAHPSSGRLVPELPGRRYREVIVPPCRIIYRGDGDRIVVVHVVRGERRIRRRRLR